MTAPAEPIQGPPGRLRRVGLWLDERFGLSALAYPIPRHANSLAYTLGGITLGTFLLLVVTGIYLAQFYDPTEEGAHASVVTITEDADGAVVRSLHFWLSTIFMASLVAHLTRVFVTAAYKRPREGTWLTGVVLFLLAGGLLYTGTILKWDQEALEALEHNSEIAELFGFFGFWFSSEFTENVSLLTRDYIAHVSILPVVLTAIVGVHLLLVKRLKVAPLPWGSAEEIEGRERDETRVPFTSHLARIGYWTLVVLGIALVLTALRPTGIGPEGVEGIEITKPPWYFLWLYPLENWFGLNMLVIAPAVLVAGLALLPFVDRSPERDPRRRRPWIALGVLVLLLWAALTFYGFVTEPVSHVEAIP
jgi:ubiquinol-cytochrome c reductase cytochrome b subunit